MKERTMNHRCKKNRTFVHTRRQSLFSISDEIKKKLKITNMHILNILKLYGLTCYKWEFLIQWLNERDNTYKLNSFNPLLEYYPD